MPTSRRARRAHYANRITKTEDDGSGNEVEREIPFIKGYTVFNVEQIEGLPEIYYTVPELKLTTVERIERAELFFASTRADIRYRGDRAFYPDERGDGKSKPTAQET
jgi:antirestriction protein ArdC